MKETLQNVLHDLKKIAEKLKVVISDTQKIKDDSQKISEDIINNIYDLELLQIACENLGQDVMKVLEDKEII